jgi:hypothetical protein
LITDKPVHRLLVVDDDDRRVHAATRRASVNSSGCSLSVGGLGVVPAVRAAPASMQRASGRGGEGRGWIARRG